MTVGVARDCQVATKKTRIFLLRIRKLKEVCSMNNQNFDRTLLGALSCGALAIVSIYSFINHNIVLGVGGAFLSFCSLLYSVGGDS